MRLTHGILGFCIGAVSATHNSKELEERMETFLTEGASELLQEMKESEVGI